jgi:DNA-binding NtrC family response regulator
MPKTTSREKLVDAATDRTRDFLAKLKTAGKDNVASYSEPDRAILEIGHLFDIFHRFLDDFDELTQIQIAAEGAFCPVPFAAEVIHALEARGFPHHDACRYLAMFYQLRRAFFFINRSLIGRSPSMVQLRLSLWDNVFTHDMRLYKRFLWNRMEDFSTLLLGETGTGKGAAATAIGRSGFIPFDEKRRCFSESFMTSYLPINLSQFQEALIESELFGHKKGAFTGAVEAHDGVFFRCSRHGAIFLDEIGEVLQERTFSPVGSHEKRRFSGRVIAATNRPIDELRRAKVFRDDFFYRLCSDVIVVPSLRQRVHEDSGELDDLLALTISRIIGEPSDELTSAVREAIENDLGRDYAWPGNVRELEQCVRRILLTRRYKGDYKAVAPDLRAKLLGGIEDGAYDAQELLSDYCKLLHSRHGTYEEVARRTNLDRRTVRKYVVGGDED